MQSVVFSWSIWGGVEWERDSVRSKPKANRANKDKQDSKTT